MKKSRKEQTRIEKILVIAKMVVSLVIVIASMMKLLDLWDMALNLAIPLFAVYYLLEMICNWKINKDMAAFCLFVAIIIIAVSCAVFLL